MDITLFKHKTPIQIRFGDTDMLGHINNSNYLSYMELARMSYINEVFKDCIDWSHEGFIQANAIIDFKLPILVNDTVEVNVRTSRVGNKSLNMEYIFIKADKKGKQSLAAEGSTVIVAFNYLKNLSIPIPESWKKMIVEFEKQGIFDTF